MVYAIVTTRPPDLDWKMRALRVLPMFLLPCLSFLTYSVIGSFMRMRKYFVLFSLTMPKQVLLVFFQSVFWNLFIHYGFFIGERKDQKTLEKLRAERQAKIDELKEKTNYYTTQQLIQVEIN